MANQNGSGARSAILWLVVLALLGMVGWLVSERNARSWFLVPEDGRLVVMKGILAPMGRQAFKTSDPGLALAYAPLVPPSSKTALDEKSFDERALLDQGIYDLLAAWARDDIASGDPARLERGLGYVGRAEKLTGISPSQRDDLSALRAESGFFEARKLLGKAGQELKDAQEKLRATSQSRSPHAMEAQLLLREVEPAVDAALTALKAAGQAAPAAPPPPAAAAPPVEAPGAAAPAPKADTAR